MPSAVYCFIDPLYGMGNTESAFRFCSYGFCPHTTFLSLSSDLRNSCSIFSICHWSHESCHNFVCSQDDFASFANIKGGNYPSCLSNSSIRGDDASIYWTIWMAWQGVNKTGVDWSCQQQRQQERHDDSSNGSSYAITRWLQHAVVAATCCQPAAAACCSWAITASKHF